MYLATFATADTQHTDQLIDRGLVPIGTGKVSERETHFFSGTFGSVEEAELLVESVKEEEGFALVITKIVRKGGK